MRGRSKNRGRFPFCSLLILAVAGCGSETEPLDLLIRNGMIIDGSGAPRRPGDLGIRDGKMVLLDAGSAASAEDVIDAEGLVVAPGFVDVHSHTGVPIADPERRLNEGFVRQGVTTVVGGPDGGHGPARLRELIAAYEQNGSAPTSPSM